MTDQTNLDLIWALTGGVTDPGDTKYQEGWVVEIPTYQNFNYVLQAITKNLLAKAEKGEFDWQAEVSYVPGARAMRGGTFWTCKTAHSNQDPLLDATFSYWVRGVIFGADAHTSLTQSEGVRISNINTRNTTTWTGNDLTIRNATALLSLGTTGASKNWLLGNVSGDLVAVDVGTQATPDGRNISVADAAVHKLYHEGNKPVQADVDGTVPEAPADGVMYARRNNNWVAVTTTAVSEEPPPSVTGSGQGWYNLSDGNFYIDINDGDSSQWVLANPPQIPQQAAENTFYDDTLTGLGVDNVQDAIDALYALIP